MDQLNRNRLLHDHFAIDSEDRKFAHHEGLMDIHDAVSIFHSLLYVTSLILSIGYRHGKGCRLPVRGVLNPA